MIDAKDEAIWDELYKDAISKISHNPTLYTKLEKVYNNPRYYAKWYLLIIEGNLERNGRVPSEINHASIYRHLGKNDSFSLSDNIEKIFTRYEHEIGIKLNTEMKRKATCFQYTANEYTGPRRADHTQAKEIFSEYEFKHYVDNVQHHYESEFDDGGFVYVWKSTIQWDDRHECNHHTQYITSNRYPCHERVAFQWKCAHELAADSFLILEKWHHRWYN